MQKRPCQGELGSPLWYHFLLYEVGLPGIHTDNYDRASREPTSHSHVKLSTHDWLIIIPVPGNVTEITASLTLSTVR